MVKNLPTMWETWVRSLGWEDPLEKGTAAHSNTLAWKIPWTEERVGHAWVTLTFTIIFRWSMTSPSAPSQPLSSTFFSLSWLWGRQSVQRRFKKGRVYEKEGLGWARTMGFKIFSTEPSKCPLIDERINNLQYIHTIEYHSAIKIKVWHMPQPWKHYAKWKKPVRGEWALCNSMCMRYT